MVAEQMKKVERLFLKVELTGFINGLVDVGCERKTRVKSYRVLLS